MNRVVRVSGAVCLVLLLTLLVSYGIVRTSSHKRIYSDIQSVSHTQTALILGAAILKNGNLSSVLKDRVDLAYALYEAKKVDTILVTGDNGTLSHNEVVPVRNYLLQKGVPDHDIFLDHAGFDTYSSMYRARDIFTVSSVIIVTQSFHLSRAVFIAHKLGIEAYGIPADNGHYKLSNYFRELPADVKALFDIVLHRKPRYLGEQIPIPQQPFTTF